MKRFYFVLIVMALIGSGCAHPISSGLRSQVDPAVTFVHVLHAPQSFIGKTMILGGVIAETRNLDGVSEIEVVEKELDYSGYPSSADKSLGRFIFKKKGYLEAEIFTKGRVVTGAGTLVGTVKGKIGETDYEFPVVEVEELKLWKEYIYPDYGYSPYYYGPIWRPFWGPHRFYAHPYYGRFYPYYYW